MNSLNGKIHQTGLSRRGNLQDVNFQYKNNELLINFGGVNKAVVKTVNDKELARLISGLKLIKAKLKFEQEFNNK